MCGVDKVRVTKSKVCTPLEIGESGLTLCCDYESSAITLLLHCRILTSCPPQSLTMTGTRWWKQKLISFLFHSSPHHLIKSRLSLNKTVYSDSAMKRPISEKACQFQIEILGSSRMYDRSSPMDEQGEFW
mmetsp:Transcript_41454/g.86969  ORF Transcript_41454/g.86969 Transcript_41454/m.86969 type:complete len:130 (-) Transcript_41454:348-737(-)